MSSSVNKIFGIGLAKTGTTSLTEALKILGYTGNHYFRTYDNLLQIIDNLDFAVDMPIQSIYKNLDYIYPNSKFILTIRDENEWLESCQLYWTYKQVNNKNIYDMRIEQFGIGHFDKSVFLNVYRNHISDVKEYFKNRSQDLLIINICNNTSWDPLCEFLNKDIPKINFPWANRTKVDYAV